MDDGSSRAFFLSSRSDAGRAAVVDRTRQLGLRDAGTFEQSGGQPAIGRRVSQQGEVVAVYGHRSAGLVLSLLGILKAGAAFLILDPGYPAARLVKMLETAKPDGFVLLEAAGEPGESWKTLLSGTRSNARSTLPQSTEALEKVFSGTPS